METYGDQEGSQSIPAVVVAEVPSLQQLCSDYFLNNKKSMLHNPVGCLHLYTRVNCLQNSEYSALRISVMSNIQTFFAALRSKFGDDDLRNIFDPIDWERFTSALKEHEEWKQKQAYITKGTVLERKPLSTTTLSDTYPLSALVQGVEWPSNVNPAKREQFLSDEEFQAHFKMTKEQFRKQPDFVRIRMKKELNLF